MFLPALKKNIMGDICFLIGLVSKWSFLLYQTYVLIDIILVFSSVLQTPGGYTAIAVVTDLLSVCLIAFILLRTRLVLRDYTEKFELSEAQCLMDEVGKVK